MSAEFEIARDKDGFLNCKYCPRIFLTNILFENHLVSQHKKDTETKPDINNIQQLQTKTDESSIQENIQIEKCSLVNLSFVSQGDLKLNRRDEHQKMAASNQGSECKNLFKCEMNFIRPIQNGDQQLGLNICGIKIEELYSYDYPPASKARREVSNLTKIKNPHTPLFSFKECVCLSVQKTFLIL